MVLKSTIYVRPCLHFSSSPALARVHKLTHQPEWFSGMLIPWYHYVPLKLDYTDLQYVPFYRPCHPVSSACMYVRDHEAYIGSGGICQT